MYEIFKLLYIEKKYDLVTSELTSDMFRAYLYTINNIYLSCLMCMLFFLKRHKLTGVFIIMINFIFTQMSWQKFKGNADDNTTYCTKSQLTIIIIKVARYLTIHAIRDYGSVWRLFPREIRN